MASPEKFKARAREAHSLVCVGLDPDIKKLPKDYLEMPHPQFYFCARSRGAFEEHFK